MNRSNQNFTAPENRRPRQDYGAYPMTGRNNWNNLAATFPPHPPGAASPNPRQVVREPWRLFQERATDGPLYIASFPGQRFYPTDQMMHIDNTNTTRNAYERQRRFSPEPSRSFQDRWNVQAPEDESKLTQDEQKQALNKLKKEVYFPMAKRPKRPNLYYRDYHYMNSLIENGKEKDEDGKNCAICLEDFEPKEVVTVTPCKHLFHEDCIFPWVKSEGRCPVCRFAICERIKENAAPRNNLTAAPRNNLTADEQYDISIISIIRAMEEAFIS